MDEEFHFHNDKDFSTETAPLTDMADDSSCPTATSNPDEEDDEFGEASDDCEPDKAFLDAILVDYHPDRLNLLEPAQEPTSEPATTLQPAEEQKPIDRNSAVEPMQVDLPNPSVQGPEAGAVEKIPAKEDDEDEGEKGDTFLSSPTSRPRPQASSMLTQMGNSTKKSFRKVSGTFWSQPFKSLGRSLRGKNNNNTGFGS